MTCFITIAGRRWLVETTFRTGKDTLAWDQSQARTWNAICRHTALTALAQLRTTAARAALTGARLAFHLRWSRWRRRHQARARWRHYSTRLQALAT